MPRTKTAGILMHHTYPFKAGEHRISEYQKWIASSRIDSIKKSLSTFDAEVHINK